MLACRLRRLAKGCPSTEPIKLSYLVTTKPGFLCVGISFSVLQCPCDTASWHSVKAVEGTWMAFIRVVCTYWAQTSVAPSPVTSASCGPLAAAGLDPPRKAECGRHSPLLKESPLISLLASHTSPARVDRLLTEETSRVNGACPMEKPSRGELVGRSPNPTWLNKVSSVVVVGLGTSLTVHVGIPRNSPDLLDAAKTVFIVKQIEPSPGI